MTILVAGSGPAGVFAALGALEAGAKVLLVDPGLRLDDEARRLKDTLGKRHWKDWTADEHAALKAASSLSQKRVFGSDFVTTPIDTPTFRTKGCTILQSNALGGLSNIWGRGIEPPYMHECDHWSFKDDFIQSMRAVLTHIPFAAGLDNLAEVMPLYTENSAPHRLTTESEELLEQWIRHKTALNKFGVHFGKTRLALRSDMLQTQGCQLCRMCFYGCSYGAMYDTGEMISYLSQHYPNFEYRSGLRVKAFDSHPSGDVEVIVENIAQKKDEHIQIKRLILAAGSPETTSIVMRTLKIKRALLKNSDLIKIPFFKISLRTPADEAYHTLSQLTLTIDNRTITSKAIIIHLFGRNPVIRDAVLSWFPAYFHAVIGKIMEPLFRRIFIGMCFLHSDDSTSIHVHYDGKNTCFSSRRSLKGLRIYCRLFAFFFKNIRKFGLVPIPTIRAVGKPGSSVHYGSSVPVGGKPPLSTDHTGQLTSFASVYVADAASLPDIPGGSYTLSIMANAHRIGKSAASQSMNRRMY